MGNQKSNKYNSVSSNIRKAREYRNYSQEYLASKLGISQNAYSKVELGNTDLTVKRLASIGVILNFDIFVLLSVKFLEMVEISSGDLNLVH